MVSRILGIELIFDELTIDVTGLFKNRAIAVNMPVMKKIQSILTIVLGLMIAKTENILPPDLPLC
jgi:hypothetical protein